jgi:superfamily I DNA/RNA helicase
LIPNKTNIDGPPVNYYTYSSAEEQENKLRGIIHNLLQNRVPPSKITILSPRTRQDSVVSLLENLNIADYGVPVGNAITFCTIHAFKGLENSVIILVDMNSFAMINLLYVGLSRAKTALYIVMSDQAANEYQEMLKRRILNNG